MRFSLTTFMLTCLCVSGLIGICLRWDAWAQDRTFSQQAADEVMKRFVAEAMPDDYPLRQPEKCRVAADGRNISIIYNKTDGTDGIGVLTVDGASLALIALGPHVDGVVSTSAFNHVSLTRLPKIVFVDSETIFYGRLEEFLVDRRPVFTECRVFRRRYPEYWWGHFYRAEVWAAALSAIGLIWLALRRLRRSRTS